MPNPDKSATPPPRQRYSVVVWENNSMLDRHSITDPFIHTTVRPRGWRIALMVLLGRYEARVAVNGDPEIVEQVLEVDPDYLGALGSKRRQAWDASLNNSFRAFGDAISDE